MAVSRGRRGEKKRKEEEKDAGFDLDADFVALGDDGGDGSAEEHDDEPSAASGELVRDNRSSFYGLLDRQELEYFKNAESMLATNALSADEREAFIASVFEEARGKELKLATNQVCSKLIERLVALATDEQLQQLVQAFEPFCADLAFQKFSSHCLEAVIVRAARISACEGLLGSIADRLGEIAPGMLGDKYAPHVLSTLLLTLSGVHEDLRSKKSQMARKYTEIDADASFAAAAPPSAVPPELQSKAKRIVKALAADLSKSDARKLALDPVTSPVVQTALRVESEMGHKSALLKLILDPADSSGFVTHCLTDPAGLRFLEMAVKAMPSKMAKKFVASLPIEKLASNDNLPAKYLVQTIVLQSKLPADEKQKLVQDHLLAEVSNSIPIALAALDLNFDEAAKALTADLETGKLDLRESTKTAIFERLAGYEPFVDKAAEFLAKLDDDEILSMCTDATLSYVVEALLNPRTPQIARRKLVNRLVPLIPKLVVNSSGSHIVDSLWGGCYKLKFVRERVATELVNIEAEVKHSPYGQKVWKNWQMEKYAHARHLWWQEVKKHEDGLRAVIEPGAPVQRNLPPPPAARQGKRRKV